MSYITMVLGQPAGLSKEVCLARTRMSVRGWREVRCMQCYDVYSPMCGTCLHCVQTFVCLMLFSHVFVLLTNASFFCTFPRIFLFLVYFLLL